jgi:hypothetical protein
MHPCPMTPTPADHRQMTVVVLLGIIALTALVFVAAGAPSTPVRDILAMILPPLAALAAGSNRGSRRSP